MQQLRMCGGERLRRWAECIGRVLVATTMTRFHPATEGELLEVPSRGITPQRQRNGTCVPDYFRRRSLTSGSPVCEKGF